MTCLALVQQVLVTGWLFLADVCRLAPRRTSVNNWIVDLNQKEQARGTALVFVPHAGGGPNAFRSVAREIRRKLPVYAIAIQVMKIEYRSLS